MVLSDAKISVEHGVPAVDLDGGIEVESCLFIPFLFVINIS